VNACAVASNKISILNVTKLVDADNMKRVWKRLLFIGLFIGVLVSIPYHMYAEGEDSDELDYDNYIAITVYPDESIIMTLRGSHSDSFSIWEQRSTLKELSLILDVTVAEEGVTTMESEFHVQLNPSEYANLANLDLDLEGHSGGTHTNVTALVDYPGYLGVNGSLGFVVVEPPYRFVLDLVLEAKLYYTYYPREDLQMIVGMVPLLETQLASEIMAASDGSIVLERLELLDYEEAPDHASFTASLRLSGDLQEGLRSALEEMGAEVTPPEEPEELSALSIESIDYHITFDGDTLSLEADAGGTVAGDFNGQLNMLKDMSLEELLESEEIDDDDGTLVARALPIDLHVQHLLMESTSRFEEDVVASTFSVEGLGLKPPSFETLLVFLEELSKKESLKDFKLVLEGGSSNNQYVAFTVPADTEEPIVEEEQRVVWDMDDIEKLDDVTYEVKTKQLDTTTIVVASAIGLVVIGAAGYFFMKK
jgi:hypothetical protein